MRQRIVLIMTITDLAMTCTAGILSIMIMIRRMIILETVSARSRIHPVIVIMAPMSRAFSAQSEITKWVSLAFAGTSKPCP